MPIERTARTTDILTGNIIEETITNDGRRIKKTFSKDGTLLNYSEDYTPPLIEVTTLGDSYKHFIVKRPSQKIPSPFLKTIMKEKEEENVNIKKCKTVGEDPIVYCDDENDLSIDRIFTTISAIKGKLMLDVAPMIVKEFKCCITPQTKKNIIDASKKLKMYGKKRPIVARFDEYGNRLPDKIEIGTDNGVTLTIVDPKDVGSDLYFELKAVLLRPNRDDIEQEDIPSVYDSIYDLPF